MDHPCVDRARPDTRTGEPRPDLPREIIPTIWGKIDTGSSTRNGQGRPQAAALLPHREECYTAHFDRGLCGTLHARASLATEHGDLDLALRHACQVLDARLVEAGHVASFAPVRTDAGHHR